MVSGLLILNDGTIQAIGQPELDAIADALEQALPELKRRAIDVKIQKFQQLKQELGIDQQEPTSE